MKKENLLISLRILLTVCAVWGWWGILYPELTMTADTYRIVYEEAGPEEIGAEDVSDSSATGKFRAKRSQAVSIYDQLLSTDRSRIRFRSRLLMNLNGLLDQDKYQD